MSLWLVPFYKVTKENIFATSHVAVLLDWDITWSEVANPWNIFIQLRECTWHNCVRYFIMRKGWNAHAPFSSRKQKGRNCRCCYFQTPSVVHCTNATASAHCAQSPKFLRNFYPQTAANNFCQLLRVKRKPSCTSVGNAQAQLHFRDDQQRAFGISNISNWNTNCARSMRYNTKATNKPMPNKISENMVKFKESPLVCALLFGTTTLVLVAWTVSSQDSAITFLAPCHWWGPFRR